MTFPDLRQLKLQVSVSSKSKLTSNCFRNGFWAHQSLQIKGFFTGIGLNYCCGELPKKQGKFWFLCCSKVWTPFFSEIWKAYYFRQRSYPEGTRTEITFSENFVLFLRDKDELDIKLSNRVFRIAQAFVSNVELKSEVQTISFHKVLWKKVISGKAYAFQHCETEVWLFLIIVYELAQTRKSHVLSWIGRCKIIFFDVNLRKKTCSQNNISCRAIEACMFSNVVYVHGHEIFVKFCEVKPSFPKWIREGTFLKKIVFDIAQWTFNCFQIWYFGTPIIGFGPLIRTVVSLEKRR